MTETLERQEVKAVAKWVHMSPRKARLVVEHIRGRSVPEARTVLAFTQRAAAVEIEKVLRSAVANAEANHNLAGDDLVVSAAYVDEGPVMKRWRAARIRKPTCHITIKLTPVERAPEPAPAPKQEEPKAEEAKPAPKTKAAPKRKPAAKKPKKTEEAES
jgi:large subunit ribosomal protein L22